MRASIRRVSSFRAISFTNGTFYSPYTPDNSIAFPKMSSVEGHESDPKQPTTTAEGGFIWPGDEGCKRKPAPGAFVMSKYLTPTTVGGK